jgi:predicted permease
MNTFYNDIVFAWRQLQKRKVTSAAVILSLALAIGACTTAFRLIDALLLRPLPIGHPEQLYAVTREGTFFDGRVYAGENYWSYPAFQQMRAAVKDQAELLAISYAERMDLTYSPDSEAEKGWVQYVSGWMFDTFELKPYLGRLLVEEDDIEPGAHPYAVVSYDYWVRRLGSDPQAIGRTFRLGDRIYEIVGIGSKSFTGTEPGIITDIFIPIAMHPHVTRSDAEWFRTLAMLKQTEIVEPVRQKLNAASHAFQAERAKGFHDMSQKMIDRFLNQTVALEPAAAGTSGMQKEYRGALLALAVLVILVLLIACMNVANLLTAQAVARAREMAIRVSIGAGRWRLVRLVLTESALLAFLAAAMGIGFSAWAAPFVVSTINPPDHPARLVLPMDWRILGFSLALTFFVMLLFGLSPALRASAVKPAGVLRATGKSDSGHHLMSGLIVAQIAFSFLVLFVAGLFVTTFERLSHRPTGFSTDRLLTLETVTQDAQLPVTWEQVADHLRSVPGVETVALAGWPLLSGHSWNSTVSINDTPPSREFVYFLNVSPDWVNAMKIPVIEGRNIHEHDTSRRVALVNKTFAKHFFNDTSPVSKSFSYGGASYEIVGLVSDTPYRNLREPILPQAYFPFNSVNTWPIREATFIVRTSDRDSRALASILREQVAQVRPDFRVSNIRTQLEINRVHTVRELLLARLSSFFGLVALLLAVVGIYGGLNYSVLQRQREIGIRMALGAQRREILSRVVGRGIGMAGIGVIAGLIAAFALTGLLTSLLYDIEPMDPTILAGATGLIVIVVLCACYVPARRASKVDPMKALRYE